MFKVPNTVQVQATGFRIEEHMPPKPSDSDTCRSLVGVFVSCQHQLSPAVTLQPMHMPSPGH